MTADKTAKAAFDVGLGSLLGIAVRGYVSHALSLSIAGAATLGTYLAFRLPAQVQLGQGNLFRSIAIDLLGLVAAGVVALPWYSYALDADRNRPTDLWAPFRRPSRFATQAVASVWFWAAVLFGLRYLWGIPSIVALVFYAFHGYVIAGEETRSGLKALGRSALIGEGKRFGLFGVAVILGMVNLLAASPLGYGVTPLTSLAAFVAITMTASISLVAGAHLYHRFTGAP